MEKKIEVIYVTKDVESQQLMLLYGKKNGFIVHTFSQITEVMKKLDSLKEVDKYIVLTETNFPDLNEFYWKKLKEKKIRVVLYTAIDHTELPKELYRSGLSWEFILLPVSEKRLLQILGLK